MATLRHTLRQTPPRRGQIYHWRPVGVGSLRAVSALRLWSGVYIPALQSLLRVSAQSAELGSINIGDPRPVDVGADVPRRLLSIFEQTTG